MNILAIDCCLRLTGAAILAGEKFFSEQNDLGRRQSSELPKITERLLKSSGLSFQDLDYIALTNGPGYFTGIRVGAAYASGLAYAAGKKIIPVSSLIALRNQRPGKILTMVYAGHGFIYAGCENFLPEGEYSHEAIKNWLAENPDAEIFSSEELEVKYEGLKITRPDLFSLCRLAKENISKAVSPLELRISYYRNPV